MVLYVYGLVNVNLILLCSWHKKLCCCPLCQNSHKHGRAGSRKSEKRAPPPHTDRHTHTHRTLINTVTPAIVACHNTLQMKLPSESAGTSAVQKSTYDTYTRIIVLFLGNSPGL